MKISNKTLTTPTLCPSVNLHLISSCNMACSYCFAHFNECKTQRSIPILEAKSIIADLARCGCEKITFSGGEPLLYHNIIELIQFAKVQGLTTMLITNGSLLSKQFINDASFALDWLGLSIDSLNQNTNIMQGSITHAGTVPYQNLVQSINQSPIKLKINTVVSAYNCTENNLVPFINWAQPERWKIMQAISVKGQNHKQQPYFAISSEQYNLFIENNTVHQHIPVITERDRDMFGSYMMINPDGCFFDNSTNEYQMSEPILKNGVMHALQDIHYSHNAFLKRNGQYDWNVSKY